MSGEPCRFGYEEHDGFRYCFAHGGFLHPGIRRQICDRAPTPVRTTGDLR